MINKYSRNVLFLSLPFFAFSNSAQFFCFCSSLLCYFILLILHVPLFIATTFHFFFSSSFSFVNVNTWKFCYTHRIIIICEIISSSKDRYANINTYCELCAALNFSFLFVLFIFPFLFWKMYVFRQPTLFFFFARSFLFFFPKRQYLVSS